MIEVARRSAIGPGRNAPWNRAPAFHATPVGHGAPEAGHGLASTLYCLADGLQSEGSNMTSARWARATICLTVLLLPTLAAARLAENITACDIRYNSTGKNVDRGYYPPLVTGVNTTNICYRHDGWIIRVGFIQNIATVIAYSRQDSARITPENFAAIVTANGGGLKWLKSSDEIWTRTDGATARMSVFTVTIESVAYKRLQAAIENARNARPMAGNRL